jgi:hypothetical protein
MSKTFKLELKIVLTDEQQQKLVEAARTVYAAGLRAFDTKARVRVTSIPKSSSMGRKAH